VDALKLKLSPKEDQKIAERKFGNFKAYECYLKARQDLWKYTEDSLYRAEQNLKNGLGIIGDNELLYAGLGQVYFNFYDGGVRIDDKYLNQVKVCANKIFKMEPNSASAFRLIGLLKMKKENALKAFKSFQRSYELNPVDPDTLLWMIYILCYFLGRPTFAAPLVKKLLEIDPLIPNNQILAAWYHWVEGRFDIALEHSRKWYTKEPDSIIACWYLSILLAWNTDYEGAYRLIDQMINKNPENTFSKLSLIFKYALQKKKNEALPLLSEEIKQYAWNDFGLPWFITDCYALIDEKEQSLKWIERAVEWGLINYPFISSLDPFLDNIRGEERFKKLMRQIKHQWENFEV
jgi:non-specific serine/threonine protein kinase